jgi:hypothetical protein
MKKPPGNKISANVYSHVLFLLLMAVLHAQTRLHAQTTTITADVNAIIATFQLDEEQITALDQGEIVSFAVAEATQKELALGLAMYLAAPPAKLVEFFKSGDLAMIDPDVRQYGAIVPESASSAFTGFVFLPDQIDEVNDLLNAEADDQFNLSAAEIKNFAALRENHPADDDATLAAIVSQQYQQLLLQRWQAYHEKGLNGIAPYARADGESSPAEELRQVVRSSKLLAHFSPDLSTAWLNYPAPLPAGTLEHFFWLNNTVDDRPAAILNHRIMLTSDAASIIVTRQFYVGHSYNSSHLIVGCLPYRNGSMIFYTHRTSTDQITGLGHALKRSIGRELQKERMIRNLEALRTAVGAL